jgi:hypothetical protein
LKKSFHAQFSRNASAQSENLIRDTYDSVFRRGLIETHSGRAKSKSNPLHRYKEKPK